MAQAANNQPTNTTDKSKQTESTNPSQGIAKNGETNNNESKRQQYVKRSMESRASWKNKEKWLKIPVDIDASSLSDFRGLMAKQRSLLSDNPNDINTLNDNTFFSRLSAC